MTEDWETRVQYNNIHKWLIIWQNTFEWFLYFISNFLARLSWSTLGVLPSERYITRCSFLHVCDWQKRSYGNIILTVWLLWFLKITFPSTIKRFLAFHSSFFLNFQPCNIVPHFRVSHFKTTPYFWCCFSLNSTLWEKKPSIEVAPTTLRLMLLIYSFQFRSAFSTLSDLIFPV